MNTTMRVCARLGAGSCDCGHARTSMGACIYVCEDTCEHALLESAAVCGLHAHWAVKEGNAHRAVCSAQCAVNSMQLLCAVCSHSIQPLCAVHSHSMPSLCAACSHRYPAALYSVQSQYAAALYSVQCMAAHLVSGVLADSRLVIASALEADILHLQAQQQTSKSVNLGHTSITLITLITSHESIPFWRWALWLCATM